MYIFINVAHLRICLPFGTNKQYIVNNQYNVFFISFRGNGQLVNNLDDFKTVKNQVLLF